MVRRRRTLGFALLLTAGLCLPALESRAQSAPPKNAPAAVATTTPKPSAHPRRKKAAPEPPAPQVPKPPPTLEQSPPTPAEVTYNNGQLTIIAQNATLSQVLRSVQSLTGASVEMPAGVSSVRVVGQLGPGQPRDVLDSLLNGSKFNYIILGMNGNPGAVQKVILTTLKLASAVNTAQNNAVPPPEESQEEENYGEPETQPQEPPPPQMRYRPNMPGRVPEAFNPQQLPQVQSIQPEPDNSGDNTPPDGAKTPEQLLQELQQIQQQQQQMQEQMNPANRQPPQQMPEQVNPANRQPPH